MFLHFAQYKNKLLYIDDCLNRHMSFRQSTGALFVRNYLANQWKEERNQNRWTILPLEDNLEKVLILFKFDNTTSSVFANLELVFQINFHEEHPFKPPSIKTHTPNGRTNPNTLLCINGLTAYHPESWSPVTTFSSIVERFINAFVDIENVDKGVGFIPIDEASVRAYASKSNDWNTLNYSEIVQQYKEQEKEFNEMLYITQMTACSTISQVTLGVITNDDTSYIYSDDEEE